LGEPGKPGQQWGKEAPDSTRRGDKTFRGKVEWYGPKKGGEGKKSTGKGYGVERGGGGLGTPGNRKGVTKKKKKRKNARRKDKKMSHKAGDLF